MKRLSCFILVFFPFALFCQVMLQKGYVRKISYLKDKKDVPIKDVRVKVETEERSDANGNFTLKIATNSSNTFVFSDIYHPDFILISPAERDLLSKKYALNPNTRIEIILANKNELRYEASRIENNIRREKEFEIAEYRRKVAEQEAELKKYKESDLKYKTIQIKRDSFEQELRKFSKNYNEFNKDIREEAEKLSRIDYKLLESTDKKNIELKKAGKWKELEKNNKSLINDNDIKKAKYSNHYNDTVLLFNAKRCKDVADAFVFQYKNDSAQFYLKKRVDIDSTNFDYLLDYATFLNYRMLQFEKSMDYYSKALLTSHSNCDKAIVLNELGMIKDKLDYPLKEIAGTYFDALDLLLTVDSLNIADNRIATSVFINIGNLQREMHDYKEAEESYLSGSNAFYKIVELTNDDNDKFFFAQKLTELGDLRIDMKKYKLAEENLFEALYIYKNVNINDSLSYKESFINTLNHLSKLNLKLNRLTNAELFIFDALNKCRTYMKFDSLKFMSSLSVSLDIMGQYKMLLNENKSAEICLDESLNTIEKLVVISSKKYNPQYATILSDYAIVQEKEKKYDLAEKYFLKSLKIRRELALEKPEVNDLQLVSILNELSEFYIQTNQYKKAEGALLESLTLCYNLKFYWGNNYDEELLNTYYLLSDLSIRDKNFKESEIFHKEAIYYCNSIIKNGFTEVEQKKIKLIRELEQIKNIRIESNTLENTLNKDLHNNNSISKDSVQISQSANTKDENDFTDHSTWFGNISYFMILEKNYSASEYFAIKALKLSPYQSWIKTNLALSLLLQNKYEDAKRIYLELKGKKYPIESSKTFKDVFLKDFDEIEMKGISHPDIIKIRSLLID